MVSAFTNNIGLEEPANGDYVGSWDVPVNSNWLALDRAAGGTTTINLAAGSITLSTAQMRSQTLVLIGNLAGTSTITVPSLSAASTPGRSWNVINRCGNSSAFQVIMTSTHAAGIQIGVPFFDAIGVAFQGTGGPDPGVLHFIGLGRTGTYWDYAGSSVPAWISDCTFPPYLLCNGSTFATASYPALAIALGGGVLPDARGRYRATLNSGTGRITAGGGGVDGDTILATGGAQTVTLSSANVPPVPVNFTDPGHNHTGHMNGSGGTQTAAGSNTQDLQNTGTTAITIDSNTTGITVTAGNNSPTYFSNLPTTYMGGLTFVRAGDQFTG